MPNLNELTFWMPWAIGAGLNGVLLAPLLVGPPKLLTRAGVFHAWILGVLLWGTLGWRGYLVVVVYFLLGSGVTRIGLADKEAAGIAEARSGARGPENVWGSAFTGSLCALGAWGFTHPEVQALFQLAFVASFATKLADTVSSEIGKAYGRRTFLITTLQPVPRGTEGAVSLEGTLAGLGGAVVQALVGWAVGLISPLAIPLCVFAAFIATNVESVIGATLQTRIAWLTNSLVNVINTLIGASLAAAGRILLQGLWPF
ncbi:MAG: TIGR00297 family protein [Gloeomargaritaceae cyanobacterium C42_A2020_066]|nr:TIGR00297 family protein [Gloeomargaritaceae cyanobacterium C42_A2020_066]